MPFPRCHARPAQSPSSLCLSGKARMLGRREHGTPNRLVLPPGASPSSRPFSSQPGSSGSAPYTEFQRKGKAANRRANARTGWRFSRLERCPIPFQTARNCVTYEPGRSSNVALAVSLWRWRRGNGALMLRERSRCSALTLSSAVSKAWDVHRFHISGSRQSSGRDGEVARRCFCLGPRGLRRG
jgi:hypothetical protein